jgi:OOP family OmpA-OmpF porin
VRGRTKPEDRTRSLDELRRVILSADRERLEQLEDRPVADEDTVAGLLPDAFARAEREAPRKLEVALESTLVRGVSSVARKQPELYGEILAPTIGAAVKKSVADALAAMLDRFNEALERSLSIRSVQWRIEAARTGRPFAEVVMLRTLHYRVEQVFLIHTPTSLVLRHFVDESLPAQAPDQVAAMLSAIDSFGREAFGPLPPGVHLNRFQLGELTVMVSREPLATLAAVIRGSPTPALGEELNDALARTRIVCQSELLGFAGDVSRFEQANPLLEPLLHVQRRKAPRRAQIFFAIVAALCVAGIVSTLWVHHKQAARAEAARTNYVAALSSEPGIVVSQATFDDGKRRIVGFRDPLAPEPQAVLASHGLSPVPVEFAPFVSADPRIVERRADIALEPPETATLRSEGGTLHVSGSAPREWIEKARVLGRTLPGVEHYDESGLHPQEGLDTLRLAATKLAKTTITFDVGQWTISPDEDEKLVRAAKVARNAFEAAAEANLGSCLELTGHTDRAGTEEQNAALSPKRSEAVAARLISLGVDPARIHADGTGGEQESPRARTVSLALRFQDSDAPVQCGAEP